MASESDVHDEPCGRGDLGVIGEIVPKSAAWAESFDGSAGSPWLLVPPDVRKAFDAVAAAGVPLSETEFGPPLLGVKCGCNEAFLISLDSHDSPDDEVARVRQWNRGAVV